MNEIDKLNIEISENKESSESLEQIKPNDVKPKKTKGITNAKQIISHKKEHQKFIEIIVMLLSSNTLPYYAEFNTFINFFETTSIPTCGVNISKEGMNFYWNRKFVDSLLNTEVLFILLHEDFHLLFDHSKRSIIYNKKFANIIQDMIINQIIYDDIMKHDKTKDKVTIPRHTEKYLMNRETGKPYIDSGGNPILNPYYKKNMGVFVPKEYNGQHIFEDLYEWMKDRHSDYKKRRGLLQSNLPESQPGMGGGTGNIPGMGGGKGNMPGKGKGTGSGMDSDEASDPTEQLGEPTDIFGKPAYGSNGQNGVETQSLDSIFDSFENGDQVTIDCHIDDDVPETARKSIVGDFMQRLKNRGLVSAEVEAILNKLRKSKRNYLKEIKRTISHHIFGDTKKKSITKPHRRGIEGLKGKKKYKNVINCVLDTSGSMGGDFEHVLSYIFQNDIHINLVQIDTVVKIVEDIKTKRDLQKMIIRGGGGTILQPAIDYILNPKHKLNKFNTVILTDGMTDSLNFKDCKHKVLILTTGDLPKYNDPKGKVKCIVIDRKNSIYG